ncbi:MAG: lasso peptide biosynthesis B2 protein [Candidatus Competibacter sp.]|nr:lasso peptide biosynthesis B2 protein [Candidatus Competibacter sp.]
MRLARGKTILAKLRARTWRERGLLLEAWLALAAARGAVLALPFGWLTPLLGQRNAAAGTVLSPEQTARALQIGWAIAAAARRTPWQSNCLAQAIAATALLRRRGIPSTLYLGVAKSADQPERLTAHAWVRCGDRNVTGGDGEQRFAVLSTFVGNG